MKNSIFLFIIGIGLVIGLLGLLISNFSEDFNNGNSIMYSGLGLAELAGFIMLFLNGSFIDSKYFRISKACIAIVIIGVLFKISHWPYAHIIFSVGILGIILLYFFSFLRKPLKKYLDYLKLSWVIIAFGGAALCILNIITRDYQILSSVLLGLAILDYLKTQIEEKKLFN